MEKLDLRLSDFFALLDMQQIDPSRLLKHGFDSWELVQELDLPILAELAFSKSQSDIILESRAKVMHRESKSKEQKQNHESNIADQQPQGSPLSEKLIFKGSMCKFTKKQTIQQKYQSIRIIVVEEKGLDAIAGLQGCKNLEHLNLSHNKITRIQGLQGCLALKMINLQNNRLTQISGINHLKELQQLDLSRNRISSLSGITELMAIRELRISNQDLKGASFTLDPQSLGNLPQVQLFQCRGNRVSSIAGLSLMLGLRKLDMRGNLLPGISEISEEIRQLKSLAEIDFRESPLTKYPKYRDYLVVLTERLTMLDDKKILPSERKFLINLFSLKHKKQAEGGKNQKNEELSMEMVGNKLATLEGEEEQRVQGRPQQLNSPKQFNGREVHQVTKSVRK